MFHLFYKNGVYYSFKRVLFPNDQYDKIHLGSYDTEWELDNAIITHDIKDLVRSHS